MGLRGEKEEDSASSWPMGNLPYEKRSFPPEEKKEGRLLFAFSETLE